MSILCKSKQNVKSACLADCLFSGLGSRRNAGYIVHFDLIFQKKLLKFPFFGQITTGNAQVHYLWPSDNNIGSSTDNLPPSRVTPSSSCPKAEMLVILCTWYTGRSWTRLEPYITSEIERARFSRPFELRKSFFSQLERLLHVWQPSILRGH